jgi:hypothetical protein
MRLAASSTEVGNAVSVGADGMALGELEPKGIAALTCWANPIDPSQAKKEARPPKAVTACAVQLVFFTYPCASTLPRKTTMF